MPRTEAGLQRVLRRLEECRAANDLVETGNGLLQLSFLVKWVRSDTDVPSFARSHELTLQALELFRLAKDRKGQVRSLIAASALAAAHTRESLLAEAERLAEAIGEETYVASVLAARARALALSDRSRAAELHRRALEIYRRTDDWRGQAQCLFGLAIGEGTPEDKRDDALEAAQIYRTLDDPAEASRCVMVAMMNAEEIDPLADLEDLAREGLQDAIQAVNRSLEGLFYGKLALIATAKGQHEEAERYRRWATDLRAADGLTPRERWENEIEMTKTMISIAKAQGHEDTARSFRDELKRLKASKPNS